MTEDISTLVPGDLVLVPVEGQANKRLLIVDDRPPDREDAVPLLGEKGGQYHLEQTRNVVHLNHLAQSRGNWIGEETFDIEQLELNPRIEV